MFSYKVIFHDEVFDEICTARGRVQASSRTEAAVRIKEFYPEVLSVNIQPIIIEEEFDCDGEWDI